MDDQFRKYINNRYSPYADWKSIRFMVANLQECWNSAIESTKEKRFGCHFRMEFNLSHPFDDCNLDSTTEEDRDCDHAKDNGIKSKDGCPCWRPIED